MATDTQKKILDIFREGVYQTITSYSKNLNKDKKFGVAVIDVYQDNNDYNISISHSGESSHNEKVIFHLPASGDVQKIHASMLKSSSHTGNNTYISKGKKLVSKGTGYSHIVDSFVKFKKFYEISSSGVIIVRSYIQRQDQDAFRLQSTTQLFPKDGD